MIRLTIRRRTILWFVIIAGLLLCGSLAALYSRTNHSLHDSLDDALEARAELLSTMVRRGGGALAVSHTLDTLEQFSPLDTHRGFQVSALPSGKVVESSPSLARVSLRPSDVRSGERWSEAADPSGNRFRVYSRVFDLPPTRAEKPEDRDENRGEARRSVTRTVKGKPIPRAVLDAARKATPGIVITSARKKAKDRRTVYALEGNTDSADYELSVSPEGRVLKSETDTQKTVIRLLSKWKWKNLVEGGDEDEEESEHEAADENAGGEQRGESGADAKETGDSGAASGPGGGDSGAGPAPGKSAPRAVLITVAEDLDEVNEELRRLAMTLAWIGPLGILLAGLGGWFLSGRIVGPLAVVTQKAGAVQAGELSSEIPLTGSGDEVDRLAATLNDTFQRLREAYEQQARFTADASHELRTPVSILRSQLEFSLRKDRPADEYRRTQEQALSVVRRMQDTVEGLLILARADSGQARIDRGHVDLAAVLREAVDDARGLAREKNLALSVETPRSLVVRGDRRLLRILAGNLLSNAVRYSDDAGEVRVSARDGGNVATFQVVDHGIGIQPEEIPRLFERFYRVDKARSRDSGGAGLGLSIAQWIAAAHGGEILVRSKPGDGATVEVKIPAIGDAGPVSE